jgi:hypothetical protein
MNKIIITDLTRFSNREVLCVAGIDTDTGQCIRPVPYLKTNRCKELKMLPGAILTGEFSNSVSVEAPHIEDMNYQNLIFNGHCTSQEFQKLLSDSAARTIEEGFGVKLDERQKHIPRELEPERSLITIRVASDAVKIVQDQYNPAKIKAHITDATGKNYSFLSVTDLGLHSYAENHYREAGNYADVNNLIYSQKEVYVRIGLSRFYKAQDGRAGFWIQVNGLYSFPNYFETARQYE